MRLLVTGARGLIGRHVAERAAHDGHEVHGVSRRSFDAGEGIRVHLADLLEDGVAGELVRRIEPTHIVHAAWETTQPTYWHSLVNLRWVKATADLASAFAETGGDRFVQIGSCAEYDWGGAGLCVEDQTPDRPATRYGLAKLAAWKAVEAAALGAFAAAEGRIFFVYGPGEDPDRLIPFICCSHLGGRVPELSSGRQRRDLLFAPDAAGAILAVAQSSATGTVNIGGGRATTLGDAARILARLAGGREDGLGRRPDREGDPARLLPDTTRLLATGWQAEIGLEEGLERTFGWWAAQDRA